MAGHPEVQRRITEELDARGLLATPANHANQQNP